MNSYTKTLEQIFSLSKVRGMNQTLSIMEELCKLYEQPQLAFPTIHVAGTNGKGSVCTKISSCLQEGGYRVGLYTSPHLSTFRERIRVDGSMISEEETTCLLQEIQDVVLHHKIPASFFEIATLLAFIHFQRKKVDVAVIETGLGGTWDATNVILPLLSVITSIGFDHTEILGNSLEEITREKAGIIKQKVPVVIGSDVPYELIFRRSKELGCALYQNLFTSFDYDQENQETARLALSTLASHFSISKRAMDVGLQAKPSCRFERHTFCKEVVFDVAHNHHGFLRLLQMLETTYPNHHYRFVVGFSRGKDISECARLIQEKAHAVHLVSGEHPRLAEVQEIHDFFIEKGIAESSIAQGVCSALHAPSLQKEVVVIAGSFFIMQEARKALGLQGDEDPCIWYDPLRVPLLTQSQT